MSIENSDIHLMPYLGGGFVAGELTTWGLYGATDNPAPLDHAWPWVTAIGAASGLLAGVLLYGVDRMKYTRSRRQR